MLRLTLFLTACCLLFASLATAADFTLTRKVVLPNGKPGAKLSVRMLVLGYGLILDRTLRTGADGTLTVKIPGADLANTDFPEGYLYISAPGAATLIAKLPLPGNIRMNSGGVPMGPPPLPGMPGMMMPGARPDPHAPLRLLPAFTQRGIVVNNTGKPVAGAVVEVSEAEVQPYSGGIPVNYPADNFVLPNLRAKTGSNGKFSLPGLYVETSPGVLLDRSLCAVRATWKAPDGKIWLGGNARFLIYAKSNTVSDPQGTRWKIELAPTLPASGRVLDSVTKNPVQGIKVRVMARSDLLVGTCLPVFTDANGYYHFPAVPQGQVLLAIVKPQGVQYSGGWVVLSEERHYGMREEAPPTSITANDIELCPLVAITGTLRDKTTGKAPGFPVLMTVEYGQRYSEGTDWGDLVYQSPAIQRLLPPDGTIAMRVPVGFCNVSFLAPGYRTRIEQEFTPADNPLLHISVERQRGILFKLVTANARKFENVEVEVKDEDFGEGSSGYARNFQPDGRWFFNAEDTKAGPFAGWQVQVSRNGTVIVPWKHIANPNAWPVVVNIP